MPSLVCSDCGTNVPWTAAGCAACGATFREIRCKSCKYVGLTERFKNNTCPRCKKDRFEIVPRLDEVVEEVGDDAFVDAPLSADEIERNFIHPEAKKSTEPGSETESKPDDPSKLKPTEHDDGNELSPDEYDLKNDPATDQEPKPPDQKDPRPILRREKAKTSVKKPSEHPARPVPKEEDARGVLKRRDWSKPVETKDAKEEVKPPEKVRSTNERIVADRTKRRVHFEMSPKAQQLLRWAAMGLPVALIIALIFYFFAGSSRPRHRRVGTDVAVDSGVLEAEASALLEQAIAYYQQGQIEQATMTLQEIISKYPLTSAAGQARAALDRFGQNQPLFGDQVAQSEMEPAAPSTPPTEPAREPAREKKKPFIGIPVGPPPTSQSPPELGDQNQITAAPEAVPGAPPQGSTLEKSGTKAKGLPAGFVAVDSAGVHSSGWPIEIICLKDRSHLMLVPAGDFEMGNASGEAIVQPVHRVQLKTFYIDRLEITWLQYKHFLQQRRIEKNAYREMSQAALAAIPSDKHPVVGLAWRDANAYAEWTGKSLPTEAQWEKAARGKDGRLHPWGSGEPKWEKPREPKQLDRVGSFAWDVSIYGCYDMAGNAAEWCADWYDPNYYQSSPAEDPEGPKVSLPPVQFQDPERVLRGGSSNWDVTWRAPCGLQEEPTNAGFRCVLEVERAAPRAQPTATVQPAAPVRTSPQPVRVPPGGYKF